MEKYMKNVAADKVFYLSNGQILNNLKELYDAINHMPEDVFFHHVTSGRNDFSTWVKDVMGEKALSAKMVKAGTPVMMKEVLKAVFEANTNTAKKSPEKKPAVVKKAAVAKKPATKKPGSKKA